MYLYMYICACIYPQQQAKSYLHRFSQLALAKMQSHEPREIKMSSKTFLYG